MGDQVTGVSCSSPKTSVKRTVLNSLGDVLGLNRWGSFQVGNCTSHFQYPIMCPRCKSLLQHGSLKQALAIGRKLAKCAYMPWRHLRIAVELFALARGESLQLNFAGPHDPLSNLR